MIHTPFNSDFSLSSKDHIKVKLDSIHIQQTYSNVIFANDLSAHNERIFNRISYPPNWGERKTFKKRPSEKQLKTKLPEWTISVWLESPFTKAPYRDGSELVMIWMDDHCLNTNLSEYLMKKVSKIPWKLFSEDFNF